MTDTDDARALAKKTVGYLKRMDWLDYKPAVEQEFAKVITRAERAEAEAAALRKVVLKVADEFQTAHRQWRMYAEMEPERDLSTEDTLEASLYRNCKSSVLAALKAREAGDRPMSATPPPPQGDVDNAV